MEELLTKEQYEDEFSVLYKCGLRIVKTQIENSREIMEISNEGRNVYHSIYSRIKEYDSVIKKCEHKGISPTAENIRDNIRDVAGIRVIALLLDDVRKIRDEIIKIPGLIITDEKDYIEHPKQNGYRSLHLIASVPVPYMGKTMPATVEIQIRTIAQELWSATKTTTVNLRAAKKCLTNYHQFSGISIKKRIKSQNQTVQILAKICHPINEVAIFVLY